MQPALYEMTNLSRNIFLNSVVVLASKTLLEGFLFNRKTNEGNLHLLWYKSV